MNTARTHLSDDNTSSPPPLRETTGMLETLLEDVVLDTFRALVFQDTTVLVDVHRHRRHVHHQKTILRLFRSTTCEEEEEEEKK